MKLLTFELAGKKRAKACKNLDDESLLRRIPIRETMVNRDIKRYQLTPSR